MLTTHTHTHSFLHSPATRTTAFSPSHLPYTLTHSLSFTHSSLTHSGAPCTPSFSTSFQLKHSLSEEENIMAPENCTHRKHYVLVHGSCHGAWSWYKLKPLLEFAGHQVTVLDLAASGTNMEKIEDVDTLLQYSEPLLQLLASIPPNEKVVLVGHSFGGLNIALAMDKFPDKVAVGVFLSAFVPDVEHKPSYVLGKHSERTPAAGLLDTVLSPCGNKTSMLFGPKFLYTKLYQLSSTEDLELAKILIRPGSLFMEDLSQEKNFSKQGYGSVPRASIVITEDLGIPYEYQHWMIQNAGINDVVEIKGADHMAMLSKPQELCDSLIQIASKYA